MIHINNFLKKHKEFLEIAFFLIVGVGVIIFTVLTAKSVISLDGDNCPQTYALFVDIARAMSNNEFSLWLPYIWGGGPNIGNFITEVFYPINWILCYIFYDANTDLVSYAIIPWNLIIHISIYFVGCFYLIKKIGCSKLNAFATSLTSTLCCALFYYRTWIVYVDGFCYLPLIILFAIMLYEAKNKLIYSILLAILFAIEACISMSLMLVISVFIFGLLFIAYSIKNSRKNILCNLKYSVFTGFLSIMLVAPLLFATLIFISNMVRYVPDIGFVEWGVKIPIEEYTKYRYGWADFLHMVSFTNYNIGVSLSAFILIFCIIGFFSRKKEYARLRYISMLAVIICGLASFGIVFPAAFYYIPGINQLREAYMYGILLNLFASIIAAFGFDTIEKYNLKKKRIKEQLFLVMPCGILLISLFCYNILSKNIVCILFVLLFVVLILSVKVAQKRLRKMSLYLCTLLIVGLCGVDLYDAVNIYMYTELDAIEQVKATCENSTKMIEYINNLDPSDKYYRMTCWGTPSAMPTNMASVLGYYDVISYMNPSFSSGVALHLGLPLEQRAQMQNIKYFLVNAQNTAIVEGFENNPNYVKVGEKEHVAIDYSGTSEGTVYIYQALCNLGDAWLVNNYVLDETGTKETMLSSIANNAVSIDRETIINAAVLSKSERQSLAEVSSSPGKNNVTCMSVLNNSLTYEIYTENSSILVTTELYYPGWNVYIDGKKGNILQVNGTNRGVIVPGGKSTIEFRFQPIGYRFGIILQFFAIFLIVFTGIWHYRKARVSGKIYEK